MEDKELYKAIESIREGLIEPYESNQAEPDLMTHALIESIFLLCRVIQEKPNQYGEPFDYTP